MHTRGIEKFGCRRYDFSTCQPEANVPHAKQPRHLLAFAAVLASVLAVLIVWWLWAAYGVRRVYSLVAPAGASAPGFSELGQVGDLFGGVNALFAAIAVVGVFWAGYLQRLALIETRQALAEEREGNSRQQFEGTFFQLIALFRSVLVEGYLEVPRIAPLSGSDTYDLDGAVTFALGDESQRKPVMDEADWDKAFWFHAGIAQTSIFEPNETKIGPLFRTLAAVFEHVEQLTNTHPNEVMHYSEIMRDQLSNSFLVLFALYAKTYNVERFTRLIYRFFLLAPIRHGGYRTQLLVEAYGPEAFGMAGLPAGHSDQKMSGGIG